MNLASYLGPIKFTALVSLLLPFFAQAQNANGSTPNISGNALFLYQTSNFKKDDKATDRNGFDLQEAELAFYSDVDPYSRLSILLTVHPEYALNITTNQVEQKWVLEPEELFGELSEVPGVTIKLGKFKAMFGKHNGLHSHAYPFVDAPIVNSQLLGSEGLNDVGLSLAALLPFGWFSEISLQGLRGEGENKEFNSPSSGDGVGVGHWKNLLDLSDSLTFEVGGSYAAGGNSLRGNTALSGADLTFKWRPTEGGKYSSWILGAEYIKRKLEQPGAEDEKASGSFVWGQYQFAERWAVVLRSETLKVEGSDSVSNPNALVNDLYNKNTMGLVFNGSEFSSYRLEYSQARGPTRINDETEEKKLYLQASFTIGSHPAHSY